jgi:hypothetical protein
MRPATTLEPPKPLTRGFRLAASSPHTFIPFLSSALSRRRASMERGGRAAMPAAVDGFHASLGASHRPRHLPPLYKHRRDPLARTLAIPGEIHPPNLPPVTSGG